MIENANHNTPGVLAAFGKTSLYTKEPKQEEVLLKGYILVLEDEPIVGKMIKSLLRQNLYEPVIVMSGEEAVIAYSQAVFEGQPFDVAVLDLTIQNGMGGEKTIAELKKIDPHVAGIATSGYVSNRVRNNYEQMGFCDIIAKPFLIKEFLTKIECAIAKHRRNAPLNHSERGLTMDETVRRKIEKRAYELYVARNGAHGYHLEDWAKAEKEIIGSAKKADPLKSAAASVSKKSK
jgi:CheY-like chemotaxis protein